MLIFVAWKQLYHATWRGLNNRIQHLKESLQRHKGVIESQASLDEFGECQSFRAAMKAKLARDETVERDRRLTRVHQWLGALNSKARHNDVAKERLRGTGEWLLRKERFLDWFDAANSSDPLLWLHGIIGAGMY